MIDLDGANQYFRIGNHTCADVWSRFHDDRRAGAVEDAKRILSRTLGRAMDEDEPTYKMGDVRRDEYAVYEQALYMLDDSATASPLGYSAIQALKGRGAAGRQGEDDTRTKQYLAPEALRWLGTCRHVVVRG